MWFNNATCFKYQCLENFMNSQAKTPALASVPILLFAIASGLSVANIYYAQPLLDQIAYDFAVSPGSIGLIITLTQIGYALGLFFLVPLGDLLNRRTLIVSQLFLSSLALLTIYLTSHYVILLCAMIFVGLLAVVAQILVAFTATLAAAGEGGRAVGKVTSGIVIGILLARTVAGFLNDLAGWRSVYLFSATATLLMSFLLYQNLPHHSNKHSNESSYLDLLKSTLTLFYKEPLLRIRAVIAALIFATFSTLWTSLVLPLSAPPFSLPHSIIGLFGLAGVAGAIAAAKAGYFADRGYPQWVTGVSLILLLLSWGFMSLMGLSIWLLVFGVILLDFAVQAVHVTNQSLIFPLRPGAHSRLVACYMIFYSIGSGVGSISATTVYSWKGWQGVCVLGAAFSSLALVFWALTLRMGYSNTRRSSETVL
jgi:predicted MFS family arabinose efflux permease